jgi:hypothetical protein
MRNGLKFEIFPLPMFEFQINERFRKHKNMWILMYLCIVLAFKNLANNEAGPFDVLAVESRVSLCTH